jgi:hypothetical protein
MVSKGSSWGTGYLSHDFDPRRLWLKDTGGILSLKQLRQVWWRLSWLILTHVLFATAPFSDSCTFSPSFTGIDPRHERNCSGLNWHEASATWKLTLTPMVGCSWLWLKTHVPWVSRQNSWYCWIFIPIYSNRIMGFNIFPNVGNEKCCWNCKTNKTKGATRK